MPDFDTVEPIRATDDEIRLAVKEADLPALMAALAMLTGDDVFLSEELRPPTPPMGASIAPQGGMSLAAQDQARVLAADALIRYRDHGSPWPDAPEPHLLDRIMRFLAKGATAEYLPLLRHELGLPRDVGAPAWTKQELAPDRPFRVAVLGAGVSGIAAAYRLHQAGVDFSVFEKNSEVGGVWWENSYPGCRLDTPNFAYSLSFAQKPDWPQQFSRQPEIQRYLASVTDKAGLRRRVEFNSEVESLTYDEATALWALRIRKGSGEIVEQKFNAVITAVGQLNRPSFPDIEGLDGFAGRVVHSAQWPRDLDVSGLRVAVIGTGASAYQIVPTIAGQVAELAVFQRNPPWMLPTPTYHDDIRPGMAWLLKHVPYYGRWYRFWQFWLATEGRLPLVEVEEDWNHPVSVGRANEALRQECLSSLERQFGDRPDLLEKVTPTYPPGAKRMLRDNGVWAAALKQPHVQLITSPIKKITKTAVVTADGQSRDVDVLVFATGFKASDYLYPMTVVGRNGRNLHEWWGGDCRAYLGITIPGFPNLFMTGGPNTGVVVNGSAIFSAECAVEYSMRAIGYLLAHGHRAMDCLERPYWEYNEYVDAGNLRKAWGVAKTTSWYKNKSGRASQVWPFTLLEYWRVTSEVTPDHYQFM